MIVLPERVKKAIAEVREPYDSARGDGGDYHTDAEVLADFIEDVIDGLSGVTSGVGLIADERVRQVVQKRWTDEHDDGHDLGELRRAAVCYAMHAGTGGELMWQQHQPGFPSRPNAPLGWPWSAADWKPSTDPLRDLAKAGALIAAEIDRIARLRRNHNPQEVPMTTQSPNKSCIIRGTPGKDPLTIIGPFDTPEEAQQFEQSDSAEASVTSMVDVLVNPANC